MRLRVRDERGSVEAVIVTPVLLLLIMTVLQFGLWYHAAHVARAAAQQGVRTARLEGGTAEDGQRRAESFLERNGDTVVGDPVVTASRDGDSAVVEVTGRSVAVVPGLRLPVRARAEAVVERFRETRP